MILIIAIGLFAIFLTLGIVTLVKINDGFSFNLITVTIAVILTTCALIIIYSIINVYNFNEAYNNRRDIQTKLDGAYSQDLTEYENLKYFVEVYQEAIEHNNTVILSRDNINNVWVGTFFNKDVAENADDLLIDLSKYKILEIHKNKWVGE